MPVDAFKNLAVSAIQIPPAPPTSGTTLTLVAGQGARFPAPPFNVTIWPASAMPDPTNAEIARVTAIAGDVLTVVRAQEGTSARTIVTGDFVAEAITKKTLDDIQALAPNAHHTTHETGGSDAIAALDAAVITTGTIASARLPATMPPGAHHTTHETGGSDAIANLNAAVITTGTIATARLPATMPPSAHHTSHETGGSDPIAALDASVLTTGTVNTARLPATMPPSAHATTHKAGGSDVIALDTLGAPSDVTTLNASTSAHGLLPKLSGVATDVLKGDGTFGAAAGGSGSGNVTGPGTSVSQDVAVFSDATGKNIADSGVLIGNVARRDQANTFTQNQTISKSIPRLTLFDTDQPADQRTFQFVNANQKLYLQSLNDAQTTGIAGQFTAYRDGTMSLGPTLVNSLVRVQGNVVVPTDSTGVGLELFQSNNTAYVQGFNRNAGYSPLALMGSSVDVSNQYLITGCVRAKHNTATLSGGTLTLDMGLGASFSCYLNQNVTGFSIPVPNYAGGQSLTCVCVLRQDATGGRTVTSGGPYYIQPGWTMPTAAYAWAILVFFFEPTILAAWTVSPFYSG